MLKQFKNYCLLSCSLFTATTLVSSLLQLLIQEKDFDSNTHILLRCAICFLGASFFYIFKVVRIKNKVLQAIVHYVIALTLILVCVHCIGFFVELGEQPPYPIFALNFTGVYLVISMFMLWHAKSNAKKLL